MKKTNLLLMVLALTFFTAATLYAQTAQTHIVNGDKLANQGDYDGAIKEFTEAIRLDPKNADTYIFRGNAYYDKKDYDRAIADFNEAIRINPKEVVAYTNRGYAYYTKNDYDRAIADFTEAIRLEPTAVRYNNRGNAYYEKKNYESAIADYSEAIRRDPNNANYKRKLENSRQALGIGKPSLLDRARSAVSAFLEPSQPQSVAQQPQSSNSQQQSNSGSSQPRTNSNSTSVQAAPVHDFNYELTDDRKGIRLLKYTGANRNLVIPRTIEGYPVKEITDLFNSCDYRWSNDRGNVSLESIIIPEGVEKIGDGAFQFNEALRKVVLPSTIREIGSNAFRDCIGLYDLQIPASIKNINIVTNAFGGCTKLPLATRQRLTDLGHKEVYGFQIVPAE